MKGRTINNEAELLQVMDEMLNHVWEVKCNRGWTHRTSVAELGYSFVWSGKKKSFGSCNYGRKLIKMSRPIVELNYGNKDHIWWTVIHELSHAIAHWVYGAKACNHGKYWKSINIQMGDDGERCYADDVVRVKGKYTLSCPRNCGAKDSQLMRMSRGREYSCGTCSVKETGRREWNPNFKMVITQNY